MRRLAPRFASRHEHSAVDGARQPAPKSAYCGTSKTIRAGASSGPNASNLNEKSSPVRPESSNQFLKSRISQAKPTAPAA